MQAIAVGTSALLLECDDPAQVRAAYDRARRLHGAGDLACTDIVPGAATLLLDGLSDQSAALADVRTWSLDVVEVEDGPLVELPMAYDGADLESVARHSGLEVAEVVRRHRASEFVVAFCGFAPGFAYLTGTPTELHVPRLSEPRTKVPAGSVGLAGPFTGVYPRSSPGGWQLIGRTDTQLWDLEREPPALLAPGTRVRFTDG